MSDQVFTQRRSKGKTPTPMIRKLVEELNRCTEKCKGIEDRADFEECVRLCMWTEEK